MTRRHRGDEDAATRSLGSERTSPVSPISERQHLDAIRDEWLQPLVNRIGELEREAGRLQAERDILAAQMANDRRLADQLVDVLQQERDVAINERDDAVRERDHLAEQLGEVAGRDAAILREAKERAWLLQEQRDKLVSRVQTLEAARRPVPAREPWWRFWKR